ncbi:MAG: hypothetical protein J0L75_09370 [Spirochaetes bacterium]|nr:hypothetical protein [Spirochaetota bacterium]
MKTFRRFLYILILIGLFALAEPLIGFTFFVYMTVSIALVGGLWALSDLFTGNDFTQKMPPEWCPKCYTPKSIRVVNEIYEKNYLKKQCKKCGHVIEYQDGERIDREEIPSEKPKESPKPGIPS